LRPPLEVNANVPAVFPIEVLDVPDVLIATVPVNVAPAVAVNKPPKVSLSASVAVRMVAVALSREKYPIVPLVLPVMFPLQFKFPVAPSTVHPVAPAPPAIFTEVAVDPPGPMLIVDPAPNALTVVALVLKSVRVPVAEVERV
jgi:hypothetical protein